MDADNPIVELCGKGMMAEGRGDPAAAKRLFEQAWERRSDDFEASTAAHYVARHQPTPAATLEWNERSLLHAEAAAAAGDERVRGFFPSPHLNLGKSHEDLGDFARAREHYARAEQCLDLLGDDGYGGLVRRGVAAGLERVAHAA
ncbi:tetratricopeptide repeat protein [Conexibacter woesei]|uniref:Uncharacterized protein n=1 Tax=Conexibacter woesei (strain DSM 14684 / CCUG 47730 / CIP 108061 / JCM 11494 / NBRC 100937 / ID131577) TaxID=469383 RepID=D3F3B6_CONWI|nr:tetratricopeptide repeat protein [Conexibacter woesei]ADB50396.1 hypothetical protein Cwoe_1970 [Conexibacter woesei DSM 14684]